MKLTETAVVMAITLGTLGAAATQVDVGRLAHRTTVTAAQVTCHTIDTAIAAYHAERGTMPTVVTDIRPYVRGDVSPYRIDQGRAAGPGCPVPPA